LLAEVEGCRLEDACLVMRCPVGTVKSRIFGPRSACRALPDYAADERTPDLSDETLSWRLASERRHAARPLRAD
jgi:hypothetical protein